MSSRKHKTQSGFSLIEIMVVIGIIGIIAAVAVPGYRDSVRKAKRAQAKITLMAMAQGLEKCFTENGTYKEIIDGVKVCDSNAELEARGNNNDGNFTITFNPSRDTSDTSFTLLATATGEQAEDTLCTVFSVTNVGIKTAEDSGGNSTTNTCW